MDDPVVESKTAEAANAAAVASEAQNNALVAIHDSLVDALKEALQDDDPDGRPLLIRRIPAICNDIAWIKRLMWALAAANGAVLMALLTLLFQHISISS